jgi:hypothetical protein
MKRPTLSSAALPSGVSPNFSTQVFSLFAMSSGSLRSIDLKKSALALTTFCSLTYITISSEPRSNPWRTNLDLLLARNVPGDLALVVEIRQQLAVLLFRNTEQALVPHVLIDRLQRSDIEGKGLMFVLGSLYLNVDLSLGELSFGVANDVSAQSVVELPAVTSRGVSDRLLYDHLNKSILYRSGGSFGMDLTFTTCSLLLRGIPCDCDLRFVWY